MPQKKQHRLVFFDNLRSILIVLVVVLHSIGGFGAIPGVRTAAATSGAMLLYYLEMVLEAFLMSALFFVAGYFAPPSLVSRNPAAFLVVKLRRLGAPLLAGALLAQIGEFSFVLAAVGRQTQIISDYAYQATIAVIAVSLMLSAPWISFMRRMVTLDTLRENE